MARLSTCGWEAGSLGELVAATTTNVAVTQTVDATIARSGGYSFKNTYSGFVSAQGSQAYIVDTGAVSGTGVSVRLCLYVTAAPTSLPVSFLSLDGPTLQTIVGSTQLLRLNTNLTVDLVVGSSAVGTTAALNTGQWYRFELINTNVVSGTVTAYLDGVQFGTGTSGGVLVRSRVLLGVGIQTTDATTKTGTFYIDDLAVNDSTGAAQNGLPGDGKLLLLRPTADSAVGTGWTNDNAATTGLSASVSANPPVGIADTTTGGGGHQIRNATSNANVNYDATMATYTAAGVGGSDTINLVQPLTMTSAPVTTSAKLGTLGVVSNPTIANANLSAAGTAGAFWGGVAAGTYPTGWKCSLGTASVAPTLTLGTAPVMRLTQVTASTRIAMACLMGIYVDYIPAAAAAAPIPDVGMALTVT